MEIIFQSHANKTHFHKKGCAPSLILKVRVFGTWKWPIEGVVLNRVMYYRIFCPKHCQRFKPSVPHQNLHTGLVLSLGHFADA